MVISEVFSPKFFHLFKKGRYNKDRFFSDLIAGIIVGIIALPLAIAFSSACGSPDITPQSGLITAIVAGLIIAVFGGSRFLIGGPTGAFIVIISGVVSAHGITGLAVATIMAGIILVAMGLSRMGAIFKFIPYPIVVGFTSGIALTIFSTQMKDFFGFPIADAVPSAFLPEWGYYFSHISSINLLEAAMSFGCLAVILLWGKYGYKKIPGAFVALVVGTAVSVILSDNVLGVADFHTIQDKFPQLPSSLTIVTPDFSQVDFEMIRGLFSSAFTIAILCAIESLLAAMVADGVTGKQHHSNTELIAQGLANIVTPIVGGIPATGALARTMASINNGARTSVAGLIHAVVLLLIGLFLMPYVKYIPLGCLAAILVVVAYNMSEWRTFKYLLKADKSDVAVLLTTFFLTVIIDLTVAIEVGVVLAIVLFVRRIMQTSSISAIATEQLAATEDDEVASMDDVEMLDIHQGVEVYEINGPYFFGLASRSEEFEQRKSNATYVRIIRMRKVPFMDSTGVKNLRNICDMARKRGVQVVLSGVQPEVLKELEKFGLDLELGRDHIFNHIVPALAYANKVADAAVNAKNQSVLMAQAGK